MREINAKSGRNLAYLWVSLSVFCVLAGFVVYTQFFVHSKPTPKPTSDGFDYDELTQLVAAGDSEAMRKLGRCFELGFNVPKSRQEALRYYTLSSEAGNMSARYQLANMLVLDEVSVAADEEKGLQLLVDLAMTGNESAQLSLVLYHRNKAIKSGRNEHLKEAYAWANLLLGGMGTRQRSDIIPYLYSGGDYKTMTFEQIESYMGNFYVSLGGDDGVIVAQKRSFELFKAIRANKAKK
jgi:TPR repeat protein